MKLGIDIYGPRGSRGQLPKDEEWFVDHAEPVNIISMTCHLRLHRGG